MGILYFFILGIAGASGSFLAGLFLDFFTFIGFSHFLAFKILFILLIGLTILALSMQKKMKPLGSLPLSNALEVIFSFRDLRAISLLGKLNKAEDSSEENMLLGELYNTPSNLAIDGLLERACSPKLATRMEAIRALEMLQKLSKKAEKALIDDAVNNPYTTAYISARILGKQNCTDAVPMLREITKSKDYMLAGEAVIALARMKDEIFRPEIENLILSSDNPRLKIMGAEALGIYHNVESIHVLLGLLREKDPPPYLRDEIILAIAAIIDTQKKFYKILARYTADNSLAATLAIDEAEASIEFVNAALGRKKASDEKITAVKSYTESFQNAVNKYVKENNGAPLSCWILELSDEYLKAGSIIKSVFSEAVIDNDLSVYDSLRLLIVHWSAQELRIWAAVEMR